MTREELALLNEIITREFGLFFPESKRQILEGRLDSRLRFLRMKRFFDYYLKLQYDLPSERDSLVRLLTNNETYFFREKAQFEALFGPGADSLKDSLLVKGELRILSAGCSSGEEPYTLNIYAKQNRFRLGSVQARIDAFDIDPERLEMARSAAYTQRSLRVVDDEVKARYFRQHGKDHFELKSLFRDGVTFRPGNIVDPGTFGSPGSYDVVFCRNVLIYFSEGALRRAIDNFAQALRPGGLLFLGHSESIIGMTPKLETVRLGNCITYKRTTV
jgi:chemotaxis protein methyltransferase CheR